MHSVSQQEPFGGSGDLQVMRDVVLGAFQKMLRASSVVTEEATARLFFCLGAVSLLLDTLAVSFQEA